MPLPINRPPARRSPPRLPPSNLARDLAIALDPAALMHEARLDPPEPWQRELLLSNASRLAVLCPRQAGKSTTVAVLALHFAMHRSRSNVLVISPTQAQSDLLVQKILNVLSSLPRKPAATLRRGRIEFANGSLVLSLPGCERTIRGHTAHFVVIDEAARVSDELYQQAVFPMIAATAGRIIALSTPFGRRGFFFRACTQDPRWKRVTVTAYDSHRISPDVIEEARSLDEHAFRQEFLCEFVSDDAQFFPSELIEAAFDSTIEPFSEAVSEVRFVDGIGPTWG
jgi:hypothetical protein